MNPPFGEFTKGLVKYISKEYPISKNNIYCTFVDRAIELSPSGFTGLISARTFVMYRDFEKFRSEILINPGSIDVFVDLGWGVLDGAQVETAAYTLRSSGSKLIDKSKSVGPFIRLLNAAVDKKGETLRET